MGSDDKPTTYDVELDHAFVWRCQPCRRSFTVSNPESTEGGPWGQPLKKREGAPMNLG